MNKISTWIIRACILFFWIAAIYLFLHLPAIYEYFLPQKRIKVLSYAGVLSSDYLDDFERDTGIKVQINYFENNQELFVKLRESQEAGYDLIMPSDYIVELLREEGLLKKFDKNRLTFLPQIYPALMGHYFDPKNEYTLPIFWGIYGLGYDQDFYGDVTPPATWGLIFDPNLAPLCVGMIDDARELILLAGLYLYGNITDLSVDHLAQIQKLLLEQRAWVQVYNDMRTDYVLVAKTCPVSVVVSADVSRTMRYFENIKFLLPEEGSFALIDSLAMPATSTKDEYVYAFLNYLYAPEVMQKYVNKFGFLPPMHGVKPPEDVTFPYTEPTQELFSKLNFFSTKIPATELNKVWISLKA
jgi:spermidine/putrescine-binding protein